MTTGETQYNLSDRAAPYRDADALATARQRREDRLPAQGLYDDIDAFLMDTEYEPTTRTTDSAVAGLGNVSIHEVQLPHFDDKGSN